MPDEERPEKTKRTRAVVDRIEDGGTAVVLVGDDEGVSVDLPASMLPAGAEGGSHLVITVKLDEASRRDAEDRIKALQEKLERRGKQQ
jgi:plasmid replication initiation protein